MILQATSLARRLGHYLSEFLDDNAPLNEAEYVIAAEAAIKKLGLGAVPESLEDLMARFNANLKHLGYAQEISVKTNERDWATEPRIIDVRIADNG